MHGQPRNMKASSIVLTVWEARKPTKIADSRQNDDTDLWANYQYSRHCLSMWNTSIVNINSQQFVFTWRPCIARPAHSFDIKLTNAQYLSGNTWTLWRLPNLQNTLTLVYKWSSLQGFLQTGPDTKLECFPGQMPFLSHNQCSKALKESYNDSNYSTSSAKILCMLYRMHITAVSYTHLTLPTILRV